ncbi:ABC transporter permease [Anaerosporobacter sp.]|uniref:ABC transporter permease n=1 Tax=Anaerosporobacter sp. TaxID=1872529 RepID=UPI00286F873A|nr:ABC transporter permease [Anaerosporobacter sp.]
MMLETLFSGAVASGTSVLYGILGETVTERVGVINLGTEGCMIVGALAAYAVAYQTGSPILGVVFAMIAGGCMAALHAYLVLSRKSNQLATGLAIMFLGLGLTAFFGRDYVSAAVEGFKKIEIPLLSKIPIIGQALFHQDLLTYLSYILCPFLCYLLYKTRFGLKLRATGEDVSVVYSYGTNPKRMAYIGVILGGMITGIGGAQLAIAYTHTWTDGMTNGRGIIATALVVLAAYNPGKAVIGAYIFGGAQALQSILQEKGVEISPFILMMLPYVITLVALFISSRKKYQPMPNELKKIIESSSNS